MTDSEIIARCINAAGEKRDKDVQELTRERDRALAERDEARLWIKRNGRHTRECVVNRGGVGSDCDCGLWEYVRKKALEAE